METFKKWRDQLHKIHSELKDFDSLSESICVGGKTIEISLGKDGFQVLLDDSTRQLSELRPYYTPHKMEFASLLESLLTQARERIDLHAKIISGFTQEAIPDAVAKRMKGEDVSGDPADMLEALVTKKMQTLCSELKVKFPVTELSLWLKPVNGLRTSVTWGEYSGARIDVVDEQNKSIRVESDGSVHFGRGGGGMDINMAILFLASFEEILKLLGQVKSVTKLYKPITS